MNTGIKYALAALRGWILLGEEKFKKEREEAWEQYIHPSLGRMRELSQNWTNPENVARLKEVEKLLKEFE
jgi:methyl-accepting chemotaxis protein